MLHPFRRIEARVPLVGALFVCIVVAIGVFVLPASADRAPGALGLQPLAAASAEDTVRVHLEPAEAVLNLGEKVTVTVQIDDVTQLYGFQYRLLFDPNLVRVIDADDGTPGVQIEPAQAFEGLSSLMAGNSVSNSVGTIWHSMALYAEANGVDGDLVLGRIVFEAVGEGRCRVRFEEGPAKSHIVCLQEIGGQARPVPIAATWVDAAIQIGQRAIFVPVVRGKVSVAGD